MIEIYKLYERENEIELKIYLVISIENNREPHDMNIRAAVFYASTVPHRFHKSLPT